MAVATGAILGAAALSTAGAVGSSIVGAKAAKEAGKEQAKAADAASQAQLDMFYQSREDLAPWREAGEAALGAAPATVTGENIANYLNAQLPLPDKDSFAFNAEDYLEMNPDITPQAWAMLRPGSGFSDPS